MTQVPVSGNSVQTLWRRIALVGFGICLLVGLAGWAVIGQLSDRDLMRANPDAVVQDRTLMAAAVTQGQRVYARACQSCHGADATGDRGRGAPNLADSDWLFGSGSPAEIERIVTYGIRSKHPKAWNMAVMPAYGRAPLTNTASALLTPGDIDDIVEFLASLQGDTADVAAVARGAAIYNDRGGCYDCHIRDGRGDPAVGAPNLTDKIWLYGDGTRADLRRSVTDGHDGLCPAWVDELTPLNIREVSLYVYALSQSAEVK